MKHFVSRAISFNPGAKYLILYNQPEETDLPASHTMQMAFRIFTMMYKVFNAANVVLLYAFSDRGYKVLITDPYKNTDECGKVGLFIYDCGCHTR